MAIKAEPFFQQLKRLAAAVEKDVAEHQAQYDEKDRTFNAPEALRSLHGVNKSLENIKVSIDDDVAKFKAEAETIHIDQILSLGSSFTDKILKLTSEKETYLEQYGFKVKDFRPRENETENKENDAPQDLEVPVAPTTPANPNKQSSRLNRTPQLFGLSEVTMQWLQQAKQQPEEREEVTVSTEEVNKQTVCIKPENTPVHSQTFCVNPGPVTPPPAYEMTTNVNRTPQLEGLSKATMDRYTRVEQKNEQEKKREIQQRKKLEQREQKKMEVPADFQHDGIICSPGLFGQSLADRSVLNLHEALSTPFCQGAKSKQDNQGLAPPIFSLPSTSKENITPTEPELLTQSRIKKENGEKVEKKLDFGMPSSPKLHGTYNFGGMK